MTPSLSKDIRCHVWPYFFWTCNSTDQTSGSRSKFNYKVGCQPGDCIWSLRLSSGVCVRMYGLTYSHFTVDFDLYIQSYNTKNCQAFSVVDLHPTSVFIAHQFVCEFWAAPLGNESYWSNMRKRQCVCVAWIILSLFPLASWKWAWTHSEKCLVSGMV